MSFFKNFDWSFKSIAKVVGAVILGIVAIMLAVALISFSFKTIFDGGRYRYEEPGYGGGKGMTSEAFVQTPGSRLSLNIADFDDSIVPVPDFSTGTDAEDFEVKTYNGTIKTRKLDRTCQIIADLKARDDVIFEHSNKNENNCYYRFKVKKAKAEEVVKVIEDLKPETLNVDTQSIKTHVESIEDELEILKKKLLSVEETLEGAQTAYDEISKLATRTQDAETLAKVIDSKLNLIERLTNQRLQIKEQIDRYNEAKANQLDRLNFTFFNINVLKDLIFDWKQIKDSWKFETKELVRNVNDVFQGISLVLATYIIRFLQGVLYLFLSIFLLKFVWIGVKRIWLGGRRKK